MRGTEKARNRAEPDMLVNSAQSDFLCLLLIVKSLLGCFVRATCFFSFLIFALKKYYFESNILYLLLKWNTIMEFLKKISLLKKVSRYSRCIIFTFLFYYFFSDFDATQPMLLGFPQQMRTPIGRASSMSSLTNVSPLEIDLTQTSPDEK